MAKKAPRELVNYRLLEFESGDVPVLVTEPLTAEHYLVVMETTWKEAAKLDRLNCDPEHLDELYRASFREGRNVAVEAMNRLWGSIQGVRRCMEKGDSDTALIYMYEAADSHRKLLGNDYIGQLRNTDAATDARKKGQRDRRARLKKYAEENGNPPSRQKDRTAWIRQFIDAEVSSNNKKVSERMIRADLKLLRL